MSIITYWLHIFMLREQDPFSKEPLRRLLGSTIFDPLRIKAEAAISEAGFVAGVRSLLEKTGGSIFTQYDCHETKDVLAEGGCLVIATHTHVIESLAITASLPLRNDVSVVVNKSIRDVAGVRTREHMIPIAGVSQQATSNYLLELFRKTPFGRPDIPKEEIAKVNIRSVRDIITRMREEELVTLFPDGSAGKNAPWFSGIGFIISHLARKNPEAVIVMADCPDSSVMDAFTLLPGVRRVLPYKPTVYFSAPIKMGDIVSQLQLNNFPSEYQHETITAHLQQCYKDWKLSHTKNN